MTKSTMQAKELLNATDAVCVCVKEDVILTSEKNGISPLMDWISKCPDNLRDASVADRVVGKAAAMLMAYSGVAEVYADIISEHAIQLFEDMKIPYFFSTRVPYIINRTKTGMCPMESCCLSIQSPAVAYEALLKKLEEMKKNTP